MTESRTGRQGLSVTFLWLAVLFCICLVASNIFVPRTWRVWGLPLQLTGGVVIFPVSYIINDLLTEVYGYRKARLVIWMGFAANVFVALMGGLVSILPDPMYPDNQAVADSFNMLFGLVPRTTAASLMAFLLGSTANAWVMSRMKVSTQGRGFGWRAIISTIVGESIDSLVFFPIVFIGLMPFKGILVIMLTQVVCKTLYEIIILPVTTVVVKKIKEKEGTDVYDDAEFSYNPFKIGEID